LVDRLLLGLLQAPGLLDQLLGGLRGAGLQRAGEQRTVRFRRMAGIGAPGRNRGGAGDDEKEGCHCQCDRLAADAADATARGTGFARLRDCQVLQGPNQSEDFGVPPEELAARKETRKTLVPGLGPILWAYGVVGARLLPTHRNYLAMNLTKA